MKRLAVIALVACNRTPAPAIAAIDAECPVPVFDAGTPPNDKSLYVVAEGNNSSSFTQLGTPAWFRYGNTLYEVRANELVKRPELDGPMAPGFPSEWAPLVDAKGRKLSVVASAAWKDGSTLRLVWRSDKREQDFVASAGAAAPPINDLPMFGYDDMTALPSGEVFAAWDDRVRRWTASGESVVDVLPSRKDNGVPKVVTIFARSATEVWVGGWDGKKVSTDPKQLPYLARFDGRSWTAVDLPPPMRDARVDVIKGGPDGSVWLTSGHSLYRREGAGAFLGTNVPFPTDGEIEPFAWVEKDGLRVDGPRDVWMTIHYFGRYVVVHTKPGDGVLDLDDGTRITHAQAAKRWYLPAAWER